MQFLTIWVYNSLENSEKKIFQREQYQANIIDEDAVYLSGW